MKQTMPEHFSWAKISVRDERNVSKIGKSDQLLGNCGLEERGRALYPRKVSEVYLPNMDSSLFPKMMSTECFLGVVHTFRMCCLQIWVMPLLVTMGNHNLILTFYAIL